MIYTWTGKKRSESENFQTLFFYKWETKSRTIRGGHAL